MSYTEIAGLVTAIGGALWGVYKAIVSLNTKRKRELARAKEQGRNEAIEEQIDEKRYEELLAKIAHVQSEIERLADDYKATLVRIESQILELQNSRINPDILKNYLQQFTNFYGELKVLQSEVKQYIQKNDGKAL